MKPLLIAGLLIVLFSPATPAAGGRITKETISSGGIKRTYYLYVPGTISANKPAPLLMLLHGSGHNGKLLVEKWQGVAEQERIILAGPDALDSENWRIPEDGPRLLFDVAEELKGKYPVDP